MSTYQDYLVALGFGRGDTIFEADAQRRKQDIEADAAAARAKAERQRELNARDVDWRMEDRGLFQSGVRSDAQKDVETEHAAQLEEIERRRAQAIADVEFGTLRELSDYGLRQRERELSLQAMMEEMEQQRQAAAFTAELSQLRRAVLLEQLAYQRRLADRIAAGWGIG